MSWGEAALVPLLSPVPPSFLQMVLVSELLEQAGAGQG